jgi:hypothetical protein
LVDDLGTASYEAGVTDRGTVKAIPAKRDEKFL